MSVNETLHENAKAQVRSIVERIENLNEQKDAIAADIKEVLSEAKGNGFDTKAIRKIVALRKKDDAQRLEEETVLATYMFALGMIGQLADTPLGESALAKIGHNPRKAQEPHGAPEGSAEAETAENVAKARDEGEEAARKGLSLASNPYLSSDPRGRSWDRGYAEANVHAAA